MGFGDLENYIAKLKQCMIISVRAPPRLTTQPPARQYAGAPNAAGG